MKLDKNYKVRVTPEQSREIHSLILLEGGEVSYGLKPQVQDEFLVVENEHGSVVIYYTDQDIFLSAEQQEIQADDLIALLTDLSKSAENPPQGAELTPEFEAVDKLAQAMKNKLAEKREQGYHGWETCKHGDLVQLLINHVDKGDPIDVANFCAFLFARGEPLTQAVLDE